MATIIERHYGPDSAPEHSVDLPELMVADLPTARRISNIIKDIVHHRVFGETRQAWRRLDEKLPSLHLDVDSIRLDDVHGAEIRAGRIFLPNNRHVIGAEHRDLTGAVSGVEGLVTVVPLGLRDEETPLVGLEYDPTADDQSIRSIYVNHRVARAITQSFEAF